MREPAFLKRNKEKWQGFEQKLESLEGVSPDEQAEMYIELTDDLSFARTFYPKSKTVNYLNSLAARLHQSIYKNKKEDRNRFKEFWQEEVPLLMYEHRDKLLLAFLIFMVSIFIGSLSTLNDETFVRLILSDAYVNKTIDNIESGDPLAIYKSHSQTGMFLMITINNIRVSFMAFVAGIIFSFGTGFILFMNGVMVGSFLTFFYKKGILLTSLSGVFLHGALELSAIVIAGTAGFIMGNSLLFPGTYSRMHSFRKGVKDGLKIVISLIPIFILAGFIESFVTRHYQSSWLLNLLIIIVSFAFIIYYFIIYHKLVSISQSAISNSTKEIME